MAISVPPRKILIIDDEEDIVEVTSEILARHHYTPIGAVKWTDALDAISNQTPDMILLDLKMPTIHGTSMLEFIRQQGIDVPVIVVSGFITDNVVRELSGLGVSGFVSKPFPAAQLIDEIERVFGLNAPPSAPEPSSVADAFGEAGDCRPLEPAPSAGDAPASGREASVDDLYRQSSPSEPSSVPEEHTQQPALDGTGDTPKMDILYQFSGGPTPEPPPGVPPSEEEILQILQKRNAGASSPAGGGTPPAESPARTPGDWEDDAAREVLQALRRLDAEKQKATPASAHEPAPDLPQTDAVEPAAPSGGPPGASVLPPSPSRLAAPAFQNTSSSREGHRLRRHRSRRPRGPRNNLVYIVVTVACVLVASAVAAIRWYTSQISLTEMKNQAQKAVIDQAKKEMLKQYQEQLNKSK